MAMNSNNEISIINESLKKPSDIIVEAKNLTVAFENTVVLKNINLKINEQEAFVIIGPSGHGKTVLLKTLAGLLVPDEGEVYIQNKNWNKLLDKEKTELLKQMGMLFQKNALFDSFTCAENIAFPLREMGYKDEKEIFEIADYFLNAVGIIHAKNLFPDEISGGMQKRLGIARALALKPRVIFYDDPTAGLDPITSKKIIELILQLKKENKSTIIAITNDMNRAYQMADQIGMVYDKSLIITGSVSETKNFKNPAVQQFINGALKGPLIS